MNTEVNSAAKATEIAYSFIKKYYPAYAKPLRAIKEGSIWRVEIDVGLLQTKIAAVKIEAKTGEILEYSTP